MFGETEIPRETKIPEKFVLEEYFLEVELKERRTALSL
jgi:hypothetical protein